jgi:hypothetical protein
MASMEMLIAPIDCVRVNVNSMELRIAAVTKKPSDCAATAAPKIQHSMRARKLYAHVIHVLSYEICAACANLEEFTHRE